MPEKRSIDLIDQLLEEYTGKEFFKGGLDRLIPLVAPYKKWISNQRIQVLTIGGTNGKGETLSFLEQFFSQTSLNIASFSSPHVLSVSERIRFNGEEVSVTDFYELLLDSKPEVLQYHLSYYELLFLVFLKLVKKQEKKIDFLLLEVGLGGRLDAVNLLDANFVGICSISRDHQELLGKTYKKILQEKLGVLRDGQFLVTCFEQSYLLENTLKFINHKKVKYRDLFKERLVQESDHYRKRNYEMAKALFQMMSSCEIPPLEALITSKGRGELVTLGRRSFIFVGAHNIDGLRKMMKYLGKEKENSSFSVFPFDQICVSFSKRNLIEVKHYLKVLLHSSCSTFKILVTGFGHFKALDKVEIKKTVLELCLEYEEYEERLEFVNDFQHLFERLDENKKTLVTGSYYFIGEFQQFLKSFS